MEYNKLIYALQEAFFCHLQQSAQGENKEGFEAICKKLQILRKKKKETEGGCVVYMN